MPKSVAKSLKLRLHFNDDVVIKTATSEIKRITECVVFDIDVSGVLCNVKVFVVDMDMSYSLLLGRRWLEQVKAKGDYQTHTYIIFDDAGSPRQVQNVKGRGERVGREIIPEVMINPEKLKLGRLATQLTDDEFEELAMGQQTIQAILDDIVEDAEEELDMWEQYDGVSEEEGEGEEEN
ncbi:hypothetical protein DFH27DRAFT_606934 [Peziza echinospora]|nr:hypothetical protein DFH27DRAFT_606934 [Peziza echinospora]